MCWLYKESKCTVPWWSYLKITCSHGRMCDQVVSPSVDNPVFIPISEKVVAFNLFCTTPLYECWTMSALWLGGNCMLASKSQTILMRLPLPVPCKSHLLHSILKELDHLQNVFLQKSSTTLIPSPLKLLSASW